MKKTFPLFVALLFFSCHNLFDGKNGKRITHFKGTNKVRQSIEYKDEKLNGWWEEYYISGKLKSKKNYVNDTIHDTSFYYHENGALAEINIFKKGSKEGCWKKYNNKGVLYNELNFLNNDLNGIVTTYSYNSGKLLKRQNYNNGRAEGLQEFFYKNGNKKSSFELHASDPCQGLCEWDEKGNPINNHFKIYVRELNKLLLEGKLKFEIRLERPQADDIVMEVYEKGNIVCSSSGSHYERVDDHFEVGFTVSRGSFIMKQVKIAALRKTKMGNTMIETTTFNVSSTNF